MLLSEVDLALIEKHKDKIEYPKGAQELIEKSWRKLQDYGTRYDTLERDYEKEKQKNDKMSRDIKFLNTLYFIANVIFAIFVIFVLSYYFR